MRNISALALLMLLSSLAVAGEGAPSETPPKTVQTKGPAPIDVELLSTEVSPGLWQPTVKSEVLGKPVNLILDTGAEGSCLPSEFLPLFEKREEGVVNDSNGQRRAYNVGLVPLTLGQRKVGEFSFSILVDYV